jgi:hypothetical protein
MRCTFYVDDDVIDPWSQQLSTPPAKGSTFASNGVAWMVSEVWHDDSPTGDDGECWIALSLPVIDCTLLPARPRQAGERNSD